MKPMFKTIAGAIINDGQRTYVADNKDAVMDLYQTVIIKYSDSWISSTVARVSSFDWVAEPFNSKFNYSVTANWQCEDSGTECNCTADDPHQEEMGVWLFEDDVVTADPLA